MAHPKQLAVKFFQTQLVKPSWVPFYTHLYKLSLRGMGILNSEGSEATGEKWLFSFIKSLIKIKGYWITLWERNNISPTAG